MSRLLTRRGASFLIAVLCLWVIVSGWTLRQAQTAAGEARSVVVGLADVDPATADLDQVQAEVAEASEGIERANGLLGRWYLEPLRPLPVIGRQLNSARALGDSADAVLAGVHGVLDAADDVLAAPGDERVSTLAGLEQSLEALRSSINDSDLGPSEGLVRPLADARVETGVQLAELEVRVAEMEIVVGGLRTFSQEGRYLVVGANVNEMQLGSGMPLTLGVMTATNGKFSVSEFRTLSDTVLDAPVPPVDEDVAAAWGFLTPGNDFRKLALTPRYADYSGPMALKMWQELTGEHLTGVLTLDPISLQALLRAVGPVDVGGAVFDENNVLDFMLKTQYDQFEDEALVEESEELIELSAQRQDVLSSVAAAAFGKLAAGSWDPFALIEAMRPVAAGRHLLAFSEDPVVQRMWELVGVAGALDGDEISVALMNLGANKLDPYVTMSVEVSLPAAGGNTLELSIEMENSTPADLNQYVTGPWQEIGLDAAGGYTGRLAVVLPGEVNRAEFVGREAPRLEVYGPDGSGALMVGRITLDRGETKTVTARLEFDAFPETLTVLPAARWPVVEWTWAGEQFDDSSARVVDVNS